MNQFLKIESPSSRRAGDVAGFALWRLGFRPFYLLGAAFAALSVPLWLAMYTGGLHWPLGWSAQAWHAHEMVFGFAVAIVVGFLFTAVRNWTGLPTPTGSLLIGLCALWVATRLAYLAGTPAVALAVELLFLALVAAALLVPLVRSRNRRNYFVGVLFVVLAGVDVAFHAAVADPSGALTPIAAGRLGLYLIATLATVIAGRVMPMFTLNAIRGLRQFRDRRLDIAALAATVLAFAADLARVDGAPLAILAVLAAVLHLVRLVGWGALATARNPLLWILHLAYAWLPLALLLMAASALGWVAPSMAGHALGLGLIGGLVIGMITRTALGHTGRMLVAGRAEVAMYLLVQCAALVRVAGPLLAPQFYLAELTIAALMWSACFLVYIVVYWPRLSLARVDGRDG